MSAEIRLRAGFVNGNLGILPSTGYQTSVDGLTLVQMLDRDGTFVPGVFSVTHDISGLVVVGNLSLGSAMQAAADLGRCAVWTRTDEEIRAGGRSLMFAIEFIQNRYEGGDDDEELEELVSDDGGLCVLAAGGRPM